MKDQLLAIIDDGGLSQQVLLLEANEQLASALQDNYRKIYSMTIEEFIQWRSHLKEKTNDNKELLRNN